MRSINKNSQYAAPPKLVSLQIASPADLVLDWATEFKGLLTVVGGLLTTVSVGVTARKNWLEGTGVDLENDRKRLQNERLEHESADLKATIDLKQGLSRLLKVDDADLVKQISVSVDKHVLPVIRRLAEQGVKQNLLSVNRP